MTCGGTSRTDTGAGAAAEQIELLTAQQKRLAVEAEHVALRMRYVGLKIEYWHAVRAGDDTRVESLSSEAGALAKGLKRADKQ